MSDIQLRPAKRIPSFEARESSSFERLKGLKSTYEKITKPNKVYKTWKDRYDRVNNIIDEDTRTSALFSEAQSAIEALLDKFLPGATSHPYFAINKPYFEVLKTALQASSSADMAAEKLDDAHDILRNMVEEADRAHETFNLRGSRKGAEFKQYHNKVLFIRGFLRQKGECEELELVKKQRSETFCELLNIYALLEIDRLRLRAAMNAYDKKMETLKEQKNIFSEVNHQAMRRVEQYKALSGSGGGDIHKKAQSSTNKVKNMVRQYLEVAREQEETIDKALDSIEARQQRSI